MSSASRSPCPSRTEPVTIREVSRGCRRRRRPPPRARSGRSVHRLGRDDAGPEDSRTICRAGCSGKRPGRSACWRAPSREGRDLAGQSTQVRPHVLACQHHRRQPQLLRHPAHDDQGLARVTGGVGHGRDAEIHVGGEPPVEAGLPVSRLVPALPGREVEEPQIHRLLQLVRPVPQQDDHTRVVSRTSAGGSGLRCCGWVIAWSSRARVLDQVHPSPASVPHTRADGPERTAVDGRCGPRSEPMTHCWNASAGGWSGRERGGPDGPVPRPAAPRPDRRRCDEQPRRRDNAGPGRRPARPRRRRSAGPAGTARTGARHRATPRARDVLRRLPDGPAPGGRRPPAAPHAYRPRTRGGRARRRRRPRLDPVPGRRPGRRAVAGPR